MRDDDLPLLEALVSDEAVRTYLRGVAESGGSAHIRLTKTPANGAPHLLDVRVPGSPAPLRLRAVPLGPPSALGWPLQLSLHHASGPPAGLPEIPDLAPLAPRSVRPSKSPPIEIEPPEAPNVAVADDFDWIERGTSHYSSPPRSIPPAQGIDLGPSIASVVRQLVDTTDPERFAQLAPTIASRVVELAEEKQAASALRLCSTLEVIAGEAQARTPAAKSMLELFRDPRVLAPFAMQALDGDGSAERLVVRAGKRGARAMYQARLQRGAPEARTRFIATLRAIGPPALPMFTTAFEHLEPRLSVPGAVAVGEDLLRALPDASDDALGQLVAQYMGSQHVPLARAATEAIARVWPAQARACLTEQLAHPAPEVAIAAMKHLAPLGIGTREVERLRDIVTGAYPVANVVRLTAIETVGLASLDARAVARMLLLDTLARTTPELEDVVVTLCRALLLVGGDTTPIAERWQASTGTLRTRLEELLRQRR